jgi:hypothetical protein
MKPDFSTHRSPDIPWYNGDLLRTDNGQVELRTAHLSGQVLSGYARGHLGNEEIRGSIEAHIHECPDCRMSLIPHLREALRNYALKRWGSDTQLNGTGGH